LTQNSGDDAGGKMKPGYEIRWADTIEFEKRIVEVELRSLKQDASSEEHVFSYARTGLKLTTFGHAWEGACTAAKISGLRFHDLRHTFATRLRGKGVHEMDIMSLLGHTTLQMTSRYTHAMPENLGTRLMRLDRRT